MTIPRKCHWLLLRIKMKNESLWGKYMLILSLHLQKMPVWNFSTFETFPMEVELFHLLSWQQLHIVLSLNNMIFVFKSHSKLSVTHNGEKNYSKKHSDSLFLKIYYAAKHSDTNQCAIRAWSIGFNWLWIRTVTGTEGTGAAIVVPSELTSVLPIFYLSINYRLCSLWRLKAL